MKREYRCTFESSKALIFCSVVAVSLTKIKVGPFCVCKINTINYFEVQSIKNRDNEQRHEQTNLMRKGGEFV